MQKVVACGVSGLVGVPLTEKLSQRYSLILLRRQLAESVTAESAGEVLWNPPYEGEWCKKLEGADAVVNLSGEPIAEKRWSASQKKAILESRVLTTRAIVEAIANCKAKPKVLVNASAIGFYGAREAVPLEESAPPGTGFLPETCGAWEAEALKAERSGVRVVLLRTGIVLSKKGGALKKMLPPFSLGLGGPLGSGRQVLSWIHIEDEVNAILKVLEDPAFRGPVNLTAPNPVSMKEFAKTLGQTLRRPAVLPAPAFALRLLLGEMSEILLTGQDVRPRKLLDRGFTFQYPELSVALQNLLFA